MATIRDRLGAELGALLRERRLVRRWANQDLQRFLRTRSLPTSVKEAFAEDFKQLSLFRQQIHTKFQRRLYGVALLFMLLLLVIVAWPDHFAQLARAELLDRGTSDWVRDRGRRIAAGLRLNKQPIYLRTTEGAARDGLTNAVEIALRADWHLLPEADGSPLLLSIDKLTKYAKLVPAVVSLVGAATTILSGALTK